MPRWAMVLIVIVIIWLIAAPKSLADLVTKAATSLGVFIGAVL